MPGLEPVRGFGLILYQSEDRRTRVRCRFEDATAEGDPDPAATCKPHLQVRHEPSRIVVMFLDHGADQANRRQQIFLRDWQQKLDDFLRFNEREVLPHAGHVSRDEADRKAAAEYEQFAARRREVAEAQGEDDAIRALRHAAKSLARRKPPRGGDA